MKSAIERAKESAKNHLDENPGHDILIADGTDDKGKWATRTCITCRDRRVEEVD